MDIIIKVLLTVSVVIINLYFFHNKKNKSKDMPSKKEISKSIDDFTNRKKYDYFTLKNLQKIPDDKIEMAITDYIYDHVIPKDYNKTYKKIKKLSKGMQYVFATWGLETEVFNGGFNQYFYNSSGQFSEEAFHGCIAFGAIKKSKIVDGAVKTFLEEIELQKKIRKEANIESFSESYKETKLGQWDDKFYKCKEDLSKLRIKYVRSHLNEFVTK